MISIDPISYAVIKFLQHVGDILSDFLNHEDRYEIEDQDG